MIVTGPNNNKIQNLENNLLKNIKIQYIGLLKEFLGIEFTRDNNSITIN
jgi:hypothetical protein